MGWEPTVKRRVAVVSAAAVGVVGGAVALGVMGNSASERDQPAPVAGDAGPGVAGLAGDPDTVKQLQIADNDDYSKPSKLLPLREGERRVDVRIPEPYTPTAPTGSGTDDYRCFILDPAFDEDVFITGSNVLPDNTDIVHHAIMFRIAPDRVAAAQAEDDRVPGPGYTCFGDAAMLPGDNAGAGLDDAPWLGAWAPGGTENVSRDGYGVKFPAGSKIVVQMHYNLLKDISPDQSALQLRVMDGDADLTPTHTYLTPGPVELPCRPGKEGGDLCDREAAMAWNVERFGEGPGNTNNALHFLCNSPVEPGPTQTCTRTIGRDMTILGAAGHMHLLGRQLEIRTNVGTDREKLLLEIPLWDFDDQASKRLKKPVEVRSGDSVSITCTHSQELRDYLPEFEDEPEKYVTWGQGTTDEMCLGMLNVAFSDELS